MGDMRSVIKELINNRSNIVNYILILLVLSSILAGIYSMAESVTEEDSMSYRNIVANTLENKRIVDSTFSYHKPLFIIFSIISYLLLNMFFDASILKSIMVLSLFSASILIILVYYFILHLTKNYRAALYGAMVFTFFPIMFWLRSTALTELPTLLAITLSFLALFEYDKRKSPILLIASMMIFGSSLLIRFASIAFMPVYIASMLYIIYKNNKLMHLTLSPFIIAPVFIYISIQHILFNEKLPIINYFIASSQHTVRASYILDIRHWILNLYYLANAYTLSVFVIIVLSLYFIFKDMKDIKFKGRKNEALLLILFSALWIVPNYLLYLSVGGLIRYDVLYAPIIALLTGYAIANINPERIKKYFIILPFALAYDILINYLPIAEAHYGEGLKHAFYTYSSHIDFRYVISVLVLAVLVYLILSYINMQLKHKLIIMLILIMATHALPQINAMKTRTHFLQPLAEWYNQDLGKGDILIAGRGGSFNKQFTKQKLQIDFRFMGLDKDKPYYNYSRLLKDIDKGLSENRHIFISDEPFLRGVLPLLEQKYVLKLVQIIPPDRLRNQFDPATIFMNYASTIHSSEIRIYEIENKK